MNEATNHPQKPTTPQSAATQPAAAKPAPRKKGGRYWPYLITGAIALNICAAIYTVVLSTDYPLDYDESYFAPYQQVENDFINIQAAESAFNRHFKIRVDGGERTRLSITSQPALLLKEGEKITMYFYGAAAERLQIDARAKQPQNTTAAPALAYERKENRGALLLEFSADSLAPGRNTLMIDALLDEAISEDAPVLLAAAAPSASAPASTPSASTPSASTPSASASSAAAPSENPAPRHKALPSRAHSAEQIKPRRFLRLELCLNTCAAEFKLPDGTSKDGASK